MTNNFDDMTAAELRVYAEDNSIHLDGAKTKTKILGILTNTESDISLVEEESDQAIVGSDKIITEKKDPVANVKEDDNGVTTVRSADTFKNKEFNSNSETEKAKEEGKVAIFSQKNMSWNGIGRVSSGYNIVTKEAAEKWLTRKGIREATPKEVAAHYGI